MKSQHLYRTALNCFWRSMIHSSTQDEMSIGTTPLTSMSIDTGTTDPVSQKQYPIAMKHYDWVKNEIEKLLAARKCAPAAPVGQPLL